MSEKEGSLKQAFAKLGPLSRQIESDLGSGSGMHMKEAGGQIHKEWVSAPRTCVSACFGQAVWPDKNDGGGAFCILLRKPHAHLQKGNSCLLTPTACFSLAD